MMLIKIMFPDELQLRVDRVGLEDTTVVISVTSISEGSICPHCGTVSEIQGTRLAHREWYSGKCL